MFISVIMPAYNAEKTVGESIESVLKQTYRDFELIIIDDCSQDSTWDIMQCYAKRDERIRILANDMNSGVSKTRNRGIEEAKGEYIAFLDSDDLWREDKLEKQVNFLAMNPETKLIFSASSFITHDRKPLDYILQVPEKVSRQSLLKQNVISCSSVLVARSCVLDIPMPSDKMHEDFAVWLTILKTEPFAYGINEPLLVYRLSKKSKSSNKTKAAWMTWRVYRYVGLNAIQSLFYMCIYTIRSLRKYKKLVANR